jgi:hypothetical protein
MPPEVRDEPLQVLQLVAHFAHRVVQVVHFVLEVQQPLGQQLHPLVILLDGGGLRTASASQERCIEDHCEHRDEESKYENGERGRPKHGFYDPPLSGARD